MSRLHWLPGLVLCALPFGAVAHQVHEIVQNAYLTLAPGELRLELDLLPGTDVAEAFLADLDPDGNGEVTRAEAEAFAGWVLDRSELLMEGVDADWVLNDIEVPGPSLLASGHSSVRIFATARRTDPDGAGRIVYANRYHPAASQWMANVFVAPAAGMTYRIDVQTRSDQGQELTADYTVFRD